MTSRLTPEREHSDYRRWSDYQHAVDCPAAEIQMRAWIDERIRRRPNQRHIWRVVKRLLAGEETEAREATNNRESIVNEGEA